MESFFAGACTWQKILLSLQVWNLFAFSEQIMRAADCKPFVQKGLGPFWTVSKIAAGGGYFICMMVYRWLTKLVLTLTVRPISEDLMLPKMARMVDRASLPETSGSRSCSRASTNSSMTPELVSGGML